MSDVADAPLSPPPLFVVDGEWSDPDWQRLGLPEPRRHPYHPRLAHALKLPDDRTLIFPDALGALLYEMAHDRGVTVLRLGGLGLALSPSDRVDLALHLLSSLHRHDRVLAVGRLLERHAADLRELASLLTTLQNVELRK